MTAPHEQTQWEFRQESNPVDEPLGFLRTKQAWADPSLIRATVYAFHSGESNCKQYLQLGLGDLLARQGESHHHIQWVFPEYQNSFLLLQRESLFFQEMTQAEKGTHTRSRFLTGASMGGWVALSLFMRHSSRFQSATLHAPSLLDFSPFDEKSFSEYQLRHQIPLELGAYLKHFFQNAFKSNENWAQFDPFYLMNRLQPEALANLDWTLSVGSEDQLGFAEGGAAWCSKWNQKFNQKRSIEIIAGAKHDPEFLSSQLQPLIYRILNSTKS